MRRVLVLAAFVAAACAGARAAPQPPLLALASDRAENLRSSRLFVIGVDGRDRLRIPSNAADSGAAVSRDGKRIAFLRGGDVWVANSDGTHQRRLTHTTEPKQDLAWAPNGRRIAFAVCADTSCRRGIDVVDVDGGGLRRVVDDALQPTWSPDSRYLAYAGETQSFGDPASIDVIPVAGGTQRRVAPVGSRPQWQPRSGRWILYDGACGNGGDLCVVRRNGGARHVLADGDTAVWSPRGDRVAVVGNEVGLGIVRLARPRRVRWIAHRVDTLPAWAANARSIAYVEQARGSTPQPVAIAVVRVDSGRSHVVHVEPATTTVDALAFAGPRRLVYGASVALNDLDLYTFRPGVKGVRQLTSDAADDRDPAWSRDGARIAYVRVSPAAPRQSSLWVADARGRRARIVAASAGALVSDPSWAPDGKHVVFVRRFEDTGQTQVALVDVRTLKVSVVPLPEEARYASPVFSPDGEWLAFDADAVLSLARPDGSGLRAVAAGTSIGAAWSPDGTRLATIREPQPGAFALGVVDVASGAVRELGGDPSPDGGEPAWAPDGRQIVFARATPDGFELVSVGPDGGGAHPITTARAANVDPAFAP